MSSETIEFITFFIISTLSISSFVLCIILALRNKVRPLVTMAPVFCFLIVILSISKFKHVHGFGFDAEMWDQKQVEAATLIDTLSKTSEALAEQVAIVASGVGMLGGLPNSSFATILNEENVLLAVAGTSNERRDQILKPVYTRIEQNFRSEAGDIVDTAYDAAKKDLSSQIAAASSDQRSLLENQLDTLYRQQQEIHKTLYSGSNFDHIYSIMSDKPVLPSLQETLNRLKKLEDQLAIFQKTRQLSE